MTTPTTDDDAPPAESDNTHTATREPADTEHPTGDKQAAENVDNESPG